MTRSYLSQLLKREQQALLADLNYLNIRELKSFCRRYSIPYRIAIEADDGSRKATQEDDRKGLILSRVRHFLRTGLVLEETCFPARVISSRPLSATLAENDHLFYGRYDKSPRSMTALLKSLTGGKFKNGAIARILAREFWSHGKAPTFAEFAAAWIRAAEQHTGPNPEWAFLADKTARRPTRNWKKLRARKAAKVLRTLHRLTSAKRRA
jgi:hypothetical protein